MSWSRRAWSFHGSRERERECERVGTRREGPVLRSFGSGASCSTVSNLDQKEKDASIFLLLSFFFFSLPRLDRNENTQQAFLLT